MYLLHISVLVYVLRFYEHITVMSLVCIVAGGYLQLAKEDSQTKLNTKLRIIK